MIPVYPTNACAFYSTIAHAAIGRIGRPAFPAPSVWRAGINEYLAKKPFGEIVKSCLNVRDRVTLHVVPAKAGTHNHRGWLLRESRPTASLTTTAAAYGSLLSQGRRESGLAEGSSPLRKR